MSSLLVTLLVLVVPGYFWARVFLPSLDWVETIAFSLALALCMVPATAWMLAFVLGPAVTLPISVASVVLVTVAGAFAYRKFGEPPHLPLFSKQDLPRLSVPAMVPVAAMSILLVLVTARIATVSKVPKLPENRDALFALPVALLVFGTVAVQVVNRHWQESSEAQPAGEDGDGWASEGLHFDNGGTQPRWGIAGRVVDLLTRRSTVAGIVFLLVLLRGYIGPVTHDWPFIRGADNYVHAIMSEMVMTQGSAESFSLYPPGFHVLNAVMTRLSGVQPLDLYPFLAPALLLLPALACYVIAQRLFGAWCGIAAAAFAGVILVSPWRFIHDGTYVDIIAAQFLLVLAVLALVLLFQSPSWRNIMLVALLGSAVVFYHTITTLYLLLLLGLFALIALPYLLLKDRPRAFRVIASLALLGALSILYAWDTYDLPQTMGSVLGLTEGTVAVDRASMVVRTQPPLPLAGLPNYLAHSVVHLGFLGALLLAVNLRRMRSTYLVAILLLLGWALIFFAGTRTGLSAFPWRFSRDLGIPLAILAAFAFVCVVRSFNRNVLISVLAVSVISLLVVLQMQQKVVEANKPVGLVLLSHDFKAAGEWLRRHNQGGTIITNPHISHAILAVSGYRGLTAVEPDQLADERVVPSARRRETSDILRVYNQPESKQTAEILKMYDVRYLALVKDYPDYVARRKRFRVGYKKYLERPQLYRLAYENDEMIVIEVIKHRPAASSPAASSPAASKRCAAST